MSTPAENLTPLAGRKLHTSHIGSGSRPTLLPNATGGGRGVLSAGLAEARRLYHREHLSKSAIARRLGMSRPTVPRLLELQELPRYVRRPSGSKLDPHKDAIGEMLDQDAEVPATVILDHLRKDGYAGGITILKQHVA